MRKQSTKERYVTRQFQKTEDPCRIYDDIQRAFAMKLEDDEGVKSFRMNVLIDGGIIPPRSSWQPKEPFMTDFLIEYIDHVAVREAVAREQLNRVSVLEKLDYSRRFWRLQGIEDWGLVVDKRRDEDAE